MTPRELELLQGTLDVLVLRALSVGAQAWLRRRAVHPAKHRAKRSRSSTARSTRRSTAWKNAVGSNRSGHVRQGQTGEVLPDYAVGRPSTEGEDRKLESVCGGGGGCHGELIGIGIEHRNADIGTSGLGRDAIGAEETSRGGRRGSRRSPPSVPSPSPESRVPSPSPESSAASRLTTLCQRQVGAVT